MYRVFTKRVEEREATTFARASYSIRHVTIRAEGMYNSIQDAHWTEPAPNGPKPAFPTHTTQRPHYAMAEGTMTVDQLITAGYQEVTELVTNA